MDACLNYTGTAKRAPAVEAVCGIRGRGGIWPSGIKRLLSFVATRAAAWRKGRDITVESHVRSVAKDGMGNSEAGPCDHATYDAFPGALEQHG